MVTIIWGTRPETRKLRSIIVGMKERGWAVQLISTDQHPDLTGHLHDDPVFAGTIHLGMPNLGGLDPFEYGRFLAEQLEGVIRGQVVVVQGDTATAWAGARAGALLRGRPVYHVEAGVRTGNEQNPWPEETFRRDIDELADAGCCATHANQMAIQTEGYDISRFPVTGNPGIDALLADQSPVSTRWRHVLVTLHRRESFGERLTGIVRALGQWAAAHPETPVLWPVHPNPAVTAAISSAGGLPGSVVLLPPLAPRPFLTLLAHAHAVLTDSGGVQEEAAALGIPCVVARQVTDRPESCEEGLAVLAPDPAFLPTALTLACRPGGLRACPSPVFGDGLATPRILDHLASLYPDFLFPTDS